MYSDVRQWKRIRNRVLLCGESRRAVAASEQISRNTLRKMLALEAPPRLGATGGGDAAARSNRRQAQPRCSSSEAAKQQWAEWL